MTTRVNYIKISNLLNLLVQNDANFEYYHFGYPSDINISIQNNFNVDSETGILYPVVHWSIPDSSTLLFKDTTNQKERIRMSLWFFKLQDYDNCGERDERTLLEQMVFLKDIAEDFFINFHRAMCEKYGFGDITTEPTIQLDSNVFKDRLISVKIDFEILVNVECNENLVDLNILPDELPECDLEDYCNCP